MNQAKKWMKANLQDHIDECGEVNMTTLAEACAIDLYDECATEAEFELAHEVYEEYEKMVLTNL